jgi:TIR domain
MGRHHETDYPSLASASKILGTNNANAAACYWDNRILGRSFAKFSGSETVAHIFISYSRKDKDFVRHLNDALIAQKREAWIDWKDIPLTAD